MPADNNLEDNFQNQPEDHEPEKGLGDVREKIDTIESNSEEAGRDERDVLAAPLNALFALMWVLLFSGRWLFVPLLQAAGVLSVEQVAAWDEGLLYKTYLTLLFLTCIVLALRAARTAQKPKSSSP